MEDGAGDWTWFERFAGTVKRLEPRVLEQILSA
jgi:hypothetical protein